MLYLDEGETELINHEIRALSVPFAIAELGQKCLEAAPHTKI